LKRDPHLLPGGTCREEYPMCKKLIKRVLNQILQWIIRSDAFDAVEKNPELKHYFDKTEGMINFDEAVLLYNLAKQAQGECIIEVGSYRGRSTTMLSRGSMDGNKLPVYAIEPHESYTGVLGGKFGSADRGAFYQCMLDTSSYHMVRLVNLSSEIVAPNWNKKVGLLWIDGDHSYDGVKRDFECWFPHLAKNAVIAFDDSQNPDLGPRQLIEELVKSGRFVEIDHARNITVLAQKI